MLPLTGEGGSGFNAGRPDWRELNNRRLGSDRLILIKEFQLTGMPPEDLLHHRSRSRPLAIFVGTKVAAKDHAEFINDMELIDACRRGSMR